MFGRKAILPLDLDACVSMVMHEAEVAIFSQKRNIAQRVTAQSFTGGSAEKHYFCSSRRSSMIRNIVRQCFTVGTKFLQKDFRRKKKRKRG